MHLRAASVSKEVEFLTLPKIKEMFKVLKMLAPVAFLLYACHSDRPPQQEGMIDKYAFGKVNQILVVADSSLWIGPVGDTFYYYFAGPYILTPQPESIFDITHFTPSQFFARSSRKEFRTIIMLADMSDPEAPTARMIRADIGDQKIEEIRKKGGCGVIVGKDKWARNQHIFYLFAFGEKALADCVATQFPAVAGRINKEDESIIEATAYQRASMASCRRKFLTSSASSCECPAISKKPDTMATSRPCGYAATCAKAMLASSSIAFPIAASNNLAKRASRKSSTPSAPLSALGWWARA
ncbi:MAG: hypothetical protein KatS3mg029_0040 [Saprospiraceae bacterium]|nr:MAG: hypothetical protein KatS3mg029_0040 [Saprospiraceae bacterium]